MSTSEEELTQAAGGIEKLPLAAAVLAIVGLADSVYLTVSHYTKTPVPCSIVEGCETVLTSSYAEFAGIPIAAFGAAAYFVAFSFAAPAGLLTALFALLIYVQGFVIGAFCHFCLVSAGTSISLFLVFLASKLFGRR